MNTENEIYNIEKSRPHFACNHNNKITSYTIQLYYTGISCIIQVLYHLPIPRGMEG